MMGSCQRLSMLRTISGMRAPPYEEEWGAAEEEPREGEEEETQSASRRYSRIFSANTWRGSASAETPALRGLYAPGSPTRWGPF